MSSVNAREIADEIFKTDVSKKPEKSQKRRVKHGIKMNEDGSCPIAGCEYICKSRKQNTFSMHINSKHKKETGIPDSRYQCHICQENLTTSSGRLQHLRNKHSIGCYDTTWKCIEEGCTKLFKEKSNLSIHILKHKGLNRKNCTDENGFCLSCGENLTGKGNVSYHFAKCSGILNMINEIKIYV